MIDQYTVTIADTASLSGAVDVRQCVVVGLALPSTWTSADITFANSVTAAGGDAVGTYNPVLIPAGTEYTLEGSGLTSKFYSIPPADLAGLSFVKVRSGTSASPVAQSGAQSIVLVVRNV